MSASDTPWLNDVLLQALYGLLPIKAPVRIVTTSNQSLTGLRTIDSVVLQEGDAILLTAQAVPQQNGIWIVSTGGWVRRSDTLGGGLLGSIVMVLEGSVGAGQVWRMTNTSEPTIDADAQTWVQFQPSAMVNSEVGRSSCRVASTANIALGGAVSSVDGISIIDGDRVLLKNQSAPAENWIYVRSGGLLVRASDADVSAEVTSGLIVYVREGTLNGQQLFTLRALPPITLGATSLTVLPVLGGLLLASGLIESQLGTQLNRKEYAAGPIQTTNNVQTLLLAVTLLANSGNALGFEIVGFDTVSGDTAKFVGTSISQTDGTTIAAERLDPGDPDWAQGTLAAATITVTKSGLIRQFKINPPAGRTVNWWITVENKRWGA